MPPDRVLLIRHGETDWNAEGRGQGFAPTELNAVGHAQAAALADYLADQPIASIYSSDLPRAWQTALPLARALGLHPVSDERWREIHLGIFEGLTRDEAAKKYPVEVKARRADFWNYAPSGGESRRTLQKRAFAAWEAMLTASAGSEVAVVSHGGTLKALLWKLLGESDDRLRAPLTNTAITTLEHSDGTWRLLDFAVTPHLTN